jgi:hypothetical protein
VQLPEIHILGLQEIVITKKENPNSWLLSMPLMSLQGSSHTHALRSGRQAKNTIVKGG